MRRAYTRRLWWKKGLSTIPDSYADEVFYWVNVSGQPHLVIPYQLDANDAKFFRGQAGRAA